jgi:hypothetical protein
MYKNDLALRVLKNESLQYDIIKATAQKEEYISIKPTNSLQRRTNFTISFFNEIELNSVEISSAKETTLANGSKLITVEISIRNNQSIELHAYPLPIYSVNQFSNLGNITSFTWKVNGNLNYSSDNYIFYNNWVFSPSIDVYPNQSINILAQTVFEGVQ